MPKKPYHMPTTRPLQVFAFDPGAGREHNNHMTISVPYEPLPEGLTGKYLAVIDYDASAEAFYEPVDLNDPAVLIAGGLAPSEADPRFHQQMVYAVATETIGHFEFALGRPIRWRTRPASRKTDPFHRILRVFPHAFQQANAFYHPDLGAVLFGYFAAPMDNPGEAAPGQTIFTCLSHDIVAHEMTHALIDGQREFLTDATGPDAAAFHEAFADIVALLQHFTYKDALLETIQRTRGRIYARQFDAKVASKAGESPMLLSELTEENPLVGLARQFGNAIEGRRALREAIGTEPDPGLLATLTEPHERGSILVSAIFDAFFTIYIERTLGLLRIAGVNPASAEPGPELHPELASRLVDEATKTASHFMNICIRALDYCPPVDIDFGDFLRAMITADHDLVPSDSYGYRAALIKAFRRTGIIPAGVTSFSEDALRWFSPTERGRALTGPCKGLSHPIAPTGVEVTPEAREQTNSKNAAIINRYAKANAVALGLSADPALKIQVFFQSLTRVSPSGRVTMNFVAELLQQHRVPIDPAWSESPTFIHRGGSVVIFDEDGNVRYTVEKSITKATRLERQQAFHRERVGHRAMAAYTPATAIDERINFQLVHRGG